MDLKQRYSNLLSEYIEDENLIALLWKNLDEYYSEKHRTYHNKTHLVELFKYFDKYKSNLRTHNTLAFSIFYHDIIYNIWKQDNEEKSADYAVKALTKIRLPVSVLEEIHQQIIATKTHKANDNDSKWFVDFDLAILGKSSEVYKNYAQLIRKEYKLIPNFMYKKGRKKVLQHFIDKPFIYATEEFKELYEHQAKQNLINELNSL